MMPARDALLALVAELRSDARKQLEAVDRLLKLANAIEKAVVKDDVPTHPTQGARP